jgi:hypothetical protein
VKEPEDLRKITETILLELAGPHPGLTEAEEAELKARLLAIVNPTGSRQTDADEMARLFREAVKPS